MARGLLLLWLVATATASQRRKNKKKADAAAAGRPAAMTLEARPLKYKDDAVGLYAKTWAAAHTNRSGIHFLERFGAIDVGCTYDVESSGAGDTLPRLGPARGGLRVAKTGRGEHVLLRGESGEDR